MQMELDLIDADETRRLGKCAARKLQEQTPSQVKRKQKLRLLAAG